MYQQVHYQMINKGLECADIEVMHRKDTETEGCFVVRVSVRNERKVALFLYGAYVGRSAKEAYNHALSIARICANGWTPDYARHIHEVGNLWTGGKEFYNEWERFDNRWHMFL